MHGCLKGQWYSRGPGEKDTFTKTSPLLWNPHSLPYVELPKLLCLSYARGLSERMERVCTSLGIKVAFKPMRTLRQYQVKVKTTTLADRRKRVV